MNQKVKAYAPLLVLIVAAVVAFVFARGGDPEADSSAESAEITLPPITTSAGLAESSTAGSAASIPTFSTIEGASGTENSAVDSTSTSARSPVSQIVDAPDSVETAMRTKYATVQQSQNLCEAVSLLLTIPDPALILSDEFGKAQVKEYVDLWEKLWGDLKVSGQTELLSSLAPIAGVFQKLLDVIKANDYTTSALATGFQDVAKSNENISPYVDQFNEWRAGNCPSNVTVKISA